MHAPGSLDCRVHLIWPQLSCTDASSSGLGLQVDFVFGYSLPLHKVVKRLPNGRNELVLNFSPAIAGLVVRDIDIKVSGPCIQQQLQVSRLAHM